MIDISKDIHSLSDFKSNTKVHLKRLRETGRAEVLTVNGKAEVVVLDASSYQILLEQLEAVETVAVLRERIFQMKRGEKSLPMRKALESFGREVGVKLGKTKK